MSEPELDDGVRDLLETRLDSFEKLEIAHALRASGGMTPEALEATCRFSAETVPATSGLLLYDNHASVARLAPLRDPAARLSRDRRSDPGQEPAAVTEPR
ncbi:MAG TPA: hypothetical protein VF516_27530 [Kofleriaceae bacterium]